MSIEYLYWCKHSLCPCFDTYHGYKKMDTPRNEYVDGEHMFPDRKHIYGGIYTLCEKGMLGYGINPPYLRDSCKHDDILIVVVERGHSIRTTKILGCLTAIIHNSRCIEINNIASRTGHSGIGTNLMHHLLEVSRNCGFSVCILHLCTFKTPTF